jgi:hypothetical protein
MKSDVRGCVMMQQTKPYREFQRQQVSILAVVVLLKLLSPLWQR